MGCFGFFRDTFYYLLVFSGVFRLFSRHYLPFNGFQWGVSSVFATLFTNCWFLVSVSSVFATLFTIYWLLVGCFLCFRDTFYHLMVFRGVFRLFSRHFLPFTGFLWGCFLCFRDTFYHLLVFHGLFPLFLRHHLPFTGSFWGVSSVFATSISIYWFFVGCFGCFRDTIYHLLVFCGVFPLFSRHLLPDTGLQWCIPAALTTPFTK